MSGLELPGAKILRQEHNLKKGPEMTTFTKSDAEATLDAVSRAYAASARLPFAKAYAAVLDTPEGKRLYTRTCSPDVLPRDLAIGKAGTADVTLESMAEDHAREFKMPFGKAMVEVLKTERGRELMAETFIR